MASKLVVIGTGGLGRETLWALEAASAGRPGGAREVLGFLTCHEDEHGTDVCGLPVLGSESWVIGQRDVAAVCCIGDPRARRRLEDFATLAPGVSLAGRVRVEYGAELGVGVSVRPDQIIGRGALVGAGSTVVDSVEENTIVAGVPARPMKRFPADQRL